MLSLITRTAALRPAISRAFAMWFTESHEWVNVVDNVGTVGISDHAQQMLGDIVFVELPEVGSIVEKGEMFSAVESVKAASDVYSPITGEVLEANALLEENPALVNESAEDAAWFMKVQMTEDVEGLMDEEAYKVFCEDH